MLICAQSRQNFLGAEEALILAKVEKLIPVLYIIQKKNPGQCKKKKKRIPNIAWIIWEGAGLGGCRTGRLQDPEP